MIEKWAVRPAPAPFDPHRHVLLIKGDMKDVGLILKKFGALCGRPTPVKEPEGFNLSLYLHGLTDRGMERITAALGGMAPRNKEEGSAVPGPLPYGQASRGEPAPAAAEPAAEEPAAELETLSPAPQAEAAEASPELVPLAPEPSAPAPAATPEPEPVAAAPAEAPAGTPLWGLAETLDQRLNFDSLSVGPFNRFAHAAATSVAGSPGTMYNPLFLHGPPGVGKSHMLHAIGLALAGAFSPEEVVLTSGPRLAHAASLALAEGKAAELEASLKQAKALLVDDFHLLAVTEQNRAFLAKVFDMFFGANLQVVMTSLYPPRSLAALEEALKISLGKGWSVDLKVPTPAVQLEIMNAFLDRNGVSMVLDTVKKFHELMGKGYFEAARWLRRLLAMMRLAESAAPEPPKAEDIFPALFEAGPPAGSPDLPTQEQLDSVKAFALPPAAAGAAALALFVPKGQEALAPWVLARFQQVSEEFKMPGSYRLVLSETYDASQPFGVPFVIGELCARAGAQAALVLGPAADSALASRSAEFSHAVSHILESLGVAAGWVAHRGTMSSGPLLRAHLDFLAFKA